MSEIRGRLRYRYCRECRYYKAALKRGRRRGSFFKILISAVVLHGMICVSMSYVLAWQEHTQVVEGVSSTIITEIVAPVIIYGFTKTVENIFQKNELAFSRPVSMERETVKNDTSAEAEESEASG